MDEKILIGDLDIILWPCADCASFHKRRMKVKVRLYQYYFYISDDSSNKAIASV